MDADKLDIDKLKTTPVGLSKLSDLVKIKVFKKDNAVQINDTSNLVEKAEYDMATGEIDQFYQFLWKGKFLIV